MRIISELNQCTGRYLTGQPYYRRIPGGFEYAGSAVPMWTKGSNLDLLDERINNILPLAQEEREHS